MSLSAASAACRCGNARATSSSDHFGTARAQHFTASPQARPVYTLPASLSKPKNSLSIRLCASPRARRDAPADREHLRRQGHHGGHARLLGLGQHFAHDGDRASRIALRGAVRRSANVTPGRTPVTASTAASSIGPPFAYAASLRSSPASIGRSLPVYDAKRCAAPSVMLVPQLPFASF